MKKLFTFLQISIFLFIFPSYVQAARTEPLIIDHTTDDITAIPEEWIQTAKGTLHIGYGHTSHGSQITSGMSGLVGFANSGGLGLALPKDIFSWNRYGTGGALHLYEGSSYDPNGDLPYDCGYWPTWKDETYEYLGTPDPVTGRGTNHPEMNVIIWSWCGQVAGQTEQSMLDTYLLPMTQLEEDYPGITFVYMTGHADGSGEGGNVHLRNQQIRQYCLDNNKVLFDFYDFDCRDPDNNYYGDKRVNDNCDYDSDGNGSLDRNWAIDWQSSHTEGVDWFMTSYCAHSQALNCNQKAYGAWWLWARLAGWPGVGVSPGDVDGDDDVDFQDLLLTFLQWLAPGTSPRFAEDINRDGKVNILDAAIVMKNWGL